MAKPVKSASKSTTSKIVTEVKAAPPAVPKLDTSKLPVTDHRRKLTKEEIKALTDTERKARRDSRIAARPSAKSRMIKNFDRSLRIVARYVKQLHGTEPHDNLNEIVDHLRAASADLGDLPDTWRPAHAPAAGKSFAVGDKVQISEKRRAHFAFLEDEAGATMRITKVTGKKVVCETPSKARVFLPVHVLVFVNAA